MSYSVTENISAFLLTVNGRRGQRRYLSTSCLLCPLYPYQSLHSLSVEAIVVIGESDEYDVDKEVNNKSHREMTKATIFERPKPKPSICYFEPNNKACDPDPISGKCKPGFRFNEDERCIPSGECPMVIEDWMTMRQVNATRKGISKRVLMAIYYMKENHVLDMKMKM